MITLALIVFIHQNVDRVWTSIESREDVRESVNSNRCIAENVCVYYRFDREIVDRSECDDFILTIQLLK